LVATGALLGLLTVTPNAVATQSDCDARFRLDLYARVGSGVSFSYAGRQAILRNGRAFNFSYGQLAGARGGDRLWVDRSRRGIPNRINQHPSTATISHFGGWKQCGPWRAPANGTTTTNLVMNWNTSLQRHYAVRICFDPVGSTDPRCGRWYIDRS
jgi:hypothetical protein